MIGRKLNRTAACTLWAAFLLGTPAAIAQDLPLDVTSAVTLAPNQAEQVRAYVQAHSKNLAGKSPVDRKRDQEELLRALTPEAKPSPAFRIAYSDALKPVLAAAAAAGREGTISSLVVAGELATPDGLSTIRANLGSADVAVRHQAGGLSTRSLLRQLVQAKGDGIGAALLPNQVTAFLRELAEKAATEKNDLVLDRWVDSLAAAGQIDEFRTDAFAALAKVVEAQAQAMPVKPPIGEARLGAMLRAVDEGVLRHVSKAGASFDPQAARSAAAMCGHLLSAAVRSVRGGALPQGESSERDLLAKICGTCQNVLPLAGRALKPGYAASTPDAAGELRKGTLSDDAAFIRFAEQVFAADGLLSKDPFGFPPKTFVK